MSTPVLSDAQRAAVLADGRDTLVTAGAGTGKTTVLVARIEHRLLSGALPSLEGLLVVTFTEKAAREMRERIHRALRGNPRLRHLLPQLPRAAISTIHAFCARFLRERFLVAGIEPGFRVLDEPAAKQAYDDALRRAFHDWYHHPDRRLRATFRGLVEMSGFDSEGEMLRRAVRRLHDYARTTENPEGYLESLVRRPEALSISDLPWYSGMCRALAGGGGRWSEGAWTRGLRLYRTALDLARDEGRKIDRHEELHRILEGGSEGLCEPACQRALRAQLAAGGFVREDGAPGICFPKAPPKANQIPGFEDLHFAAKKAFEHRLICEFPWDEARLLAEGAAIQRATETMVSLVRDTEAHYQRFKERGGFLDFSDLEIHTLRVLRALGESSRGIYRECLVDEYQDVNRLQEEILSRLVPEEGRFRVGDLKQSIYQFRLADPTIFLGLMEGRPAVRRPQDLESTAGPITVYLGENHRSRPAVLDFTNLVFERLFEKEQIGSSYSEQALAAARKPTSAPVELHAIACARDGAILAVERQARLAARRLRAMILEERVMIPGREGVERPATWRDAAVLLRVSGRAELFLRVFREEGVPGALGAGGSLLDEEAVQDFRSLLSVVDNPRDDIALAAMLRSPLFSVPDADLLRFRLARVDAHNLIDAVAAEAYRDDPAAEGSAFRPLFAAGALAGDPAADQRELIADSLARRARSILERIRAWREEAGVRGLTEFLRFLLAESGLLARLQGMAHPAGHRAALDKVLALAGAYESERGPSLHGFLSRLSSLEVSGGIEGVPLMGEGDDAVTILTVHRAKGLEFPLVVVPQLEWPFRQEDLGGKLRVGREWIGMRRLNEEDWTQEDSWARRLLAQQQEQAQREEEARILYVALTRARERLILIGMSPPGWERPVWPAGAAAALMRESLRRARSALGWLLPIAHDPAIDPASAPFRFVEHAADAPEVCRASTVPEPAAGAAEAAGTAAAGAPAGATSGRRADALPADVRPELDRLIERIGREASYPPLAALGAAGLRAKYWVTELKTLADLERRQDLEEEGAQIIAAPEMGDDDSAAVAPHSPPATPGSGARGPVSGARAADAYAGTLFSGITAPGGRESEEAAARRGILYHTALSRLDLAATTPAELERQFASFAAEPWWEGASRDAEIEVGIASFFRSPTGHGLSAAAAAGTVEREVPFSLKVPLRRLLPLLGELRRAIASDARWSEGIWSRALDETWVLVQGRIDCLFVQDGRWCLLDWKTDRVRAEVAVERARSYGVQMRLYRDAVDGLWGEPGDAWLVFVAAGKEVLAAGAGREREP